jgi:naphthalene 1,2-dioxygenase ferredoxin component
VYLRQRVDPELDHLSHLSLSAARAIAGVSAAQNVFEVTMSGEWVPVAARDDVPEGDVIAVTVGDRDIALYGVDGNVYATANICTHGHARLCEGFLEGNEIECPLHQGRFDVTTGKAVLEPVTEDIRTFPVKIEDGQVLLLIE